MHLELVGPALLAARAAAPALELLLARGRRERRAAAALEPWLGAAFGLEGPLPAGALSAHALGEAAAEGHWLRADPVHLRADRDLVLLLPGACFEIAQPEANALCEELNRLFDGKLALRACTPDAWSLRADAPLPADARSTLEVAGREGGAQLPHRQLRTLLAEAQMALSQHAANAAREARGAPMVNSVWLWGAGALPAAATGPWHSVSATEPAALGLARLAGMRQHAPGESAAAWLERAPEDGRHLVLLDGLRAAAVLGDGEALARGLAALEARWFVPLLAALRAGRIGMVTVHVPDAGLAVETVRADLRRFWRRPRPLARYLEAAA